MDRKQTAYDMTTSHSIEPFHHSDQQLQPNKQPSRVQRPPQPQREKRVKETLVTDPTIDPNEYRPEDGFVTFFDFACYLPQQARECNIAFQGYNGKKKVGEPLMCEVVSSEPMGNNTRENKCIFNKRFLVKNIPNGENCRLLIFVWAQDNNQKGKKIPVGWTWLNIFDNGSELVFNRW